MVGLSFLRKSFDFLENFESSKDFKTTQAKTSLQELQGNLLIVNSLASCSKYHMHVQDKNKFTLNTFYGILLDHQTHTKLCPNTNEKDDTDNI